MKLISLFFSAIIFCCSNNIQAQKGLPTVELLTSGAKTSLRGLSVVNDNVIWVSGSNGTIGKTANGGKNWDWLKVKGFETRDFRDVEAFDASTAIIIAVDEPAYILKTTDAGETWKIVYENKTKGMFLDAMEFWNEQNGVVLGDPINGKFFLAKTSDSGNTWQEIPFEKRPVADSGEACFAASGTNIRVLDRDESIFVSGGKRSRIFTRNNVSELPIIQGKETTGANSISVYDDDKAKAGKHMIVAGGDFNADTSAEKNCFFTNNGGKTWIAPKTPPHGYRSCVEFLSKKIILACGLTGVDYSFDGGKTFNLISKEGFHVCRIAKYGTSVFLAGANGKVAKLHWRED
jgi:photosystem II stability/assembly factor-like uncharacterized protein